VIGDAVNVSWKIQELTKDLGYDLIVGEQVRDLVVEHFELRPFGRTSIPGLHTSMELFGVCGPVDVKAEPATDHVTV
jgi:class 3 adenylate cyclase